jgi:hypothetical protein
MEPEQSMHYKEMEQELRLRPPKIVKLPDGSEVWEREVTPPTGEEQNAWPTPFSSRKLQTLRNRSTDEQFLNVFGDDPWFASPPGRLLLDKPVVEELGDGTYQVTYRMTILPDEHKEEGNDGKADD